MTIGTDLLTRLPARILLVGYPGSGKTGSLSALANAGLKLRVLSFDKRGNARPLLMFTKPEFRKNIDIQFFEDKTKLGQRAIEISGTPTALSSAYRMMKHWEYETPEGKFDLGVPEKDWGPDTVLVLDSISSHTDAAMNWAIAAMNKTATTISKPVWGLAAKNQLAFIKALNSNVNNFHVIVLSHLKMIGPEDSDKSEDPSVQKRKRQAGALIDTRLWPTAVGRQLPQSLSGEFDTVLEVRSDPKPGRPDRRVIVGLPRPELDLKLPIVGIDEKYDISDGLLTILSKLTGGPEQWFAKKE